MIFNQNTLESLAADYVQELYQTKSKPSLYFHNFQHIEAVVKACSDMAAYYMLAKDDRNALMLAAWLHDTGYLESDSAEHEIASVQIAKKFMSENSLSEEFIAKVEALILVTKMPQQPKDLPQQIICDADLSHLGSDDFSDLSKALKNEINADAPEQFSKQEWAAKTIKFLESHRYFTEYCLTRLEPAKQHNLKKLRKKYPEELPVVRKQVPEVLPTKTDEAVKEKKAKNERPDRGVETMFRTTSSNHLKLSEMADSKAHIIISVNSIILSVVISVLLTKLDQYPNYIVPTALLLVVCVLAIIFSVLTTRPNVTKGKFVKEEILTQKPNLLFFGNFHEMSLEDYTWGMNEMMNDRDYLYGTMIKDIYSLGVVLAKKYRFLRISYNIFMFGLIASVVAFGIATFFHPVN